MKAIRRFLARRRLQRIVDRNLKSYELRRFRERRTAALKHSRGAA